MPTDDKGCPLCGIDPAELRARPDDDTQAKLLRIMAGLRGENERLRAELRGYRRHEAGINEAINMGDGSYRP